MRKPRIAIEKFQTLYLNNNRKGKLTPLQWDMIDSYNAVVSEENVLKNE
jgi:hypothetical protein